MLGKAVKLTFKKFFISAILQVSFLSCFLSIRYFISFTKLGSRGFYFKVTFKLLRFSPFFLNLNTAVTLQSSVLFSLVFHGLLVYLFSKLVATPNSLIGLRFLVLELASPLIAGCLKASQGLGKPVCLFVFKPPLLTKLVCLKRSIVPFF